MFSKNLVLEKLLKNEPEDMRIVYLASIKDDQLHPGSKAIAIFSKVEFKPEQFENE